MVENVIWPAYLDADLSRAEGRRVSEDQRSRNRRSTRSRSPSSRSGTTPRSIERDKSYSREHWADRGRVVVRGADDSTKNDLVKPWRRTSSRCATDMRRVGAVVRTAQGLAILRADEADDAGSDTPDEFRDEIGTMVLDDDLEGSAASSTSSVPSRGRIWR